MHLYFSDLKYSLNTCLKNNKNQSIYQQIHLILTPYDCTIQSKIFSILLCNLFLLKKLKNLEGGGHFCLPLFWTFVNVCPWFQIHDGLQIMCFVTCAWWILRLTSGAHLLSWWGLNPRHVGHIFPYFAQPLLLIWFVSLNAV